MEYVKRALNIILLPFKFLFKVLAIICFFILIFSHFLVFSFSLLPIFVFQVLEWIFVCPIYYIVTGKKYLEKYNCISDMALDLVFLEKPYYIKSNEPKHASYIEHMIYGKDGDYKDNDFYTRFWRKIMKISLKLKYE